MFSLYKWMVLVILVIAPSTSYAKDSLKNNMYRGVLAMKGYYTHITPRYAKRIVQESLDATKPNKKGYTLIKPQILLGLAFNESDLRWWLVTGRTYRKDCGLCQNHVALFRRTAPGMRLLCKQITHSTRLSFKYAMKELHEVDKRWCTPIYGSNPPKNSSKTRIIRWKNKRYRCLLNLYNQGPRFFKRMTCNLRMKPGESYHKYRSRVLRCRYRNKYWLRSLCFSKGLELGKAPRITCRRAQSINWIKKVYK